MRYRTDTTEIYVHAGLGADGNDGTRAAPLASTLEALDRIPPTPWGQSFLIGYLPGHLEVMDRLILPPILGAGPVDQVSAIGGAGDPAWDYLRTQIRLQAVPSLVEDVHGTVGIAEETSGQVVVTDAAKAWTPDQHIGRSVFNPGAPGEVGVVAGNTATELFITMVSGSLSGGGVRIVDRQAELRVARGIQIQAVTAAIAFVGLNLTSTLAPALDMLNPGLVQLLMCGVRGGIQTRDAAGRLQVDGCNLELGFLALNAGRVAIRQSRLAHLRTGFHAVTGQYDVYGCVIDDSDPLGHAGTGTPQGGFRVDNCRFRKPRAHGIVGYGGNRCRVSRTRIDDAQGHAIYLDGPGATLIDTVTGTGSTGYGCVVTNDATANVRGEVTVRGAGVGDDHGEVLLGGGTPVRWTQAAQPMSVDGSRLAWG